VSKNHPERKEVGRSIREDIFPKVMFQQDILTYWEPREDNPGSWKSYRACWFWPEDAGSPMTGDRIGFLTLLHGIDSCGQVVTVPRRWKVRCACGEETNASTFRLKHERVTPIFCGRCACGPGFAGAKAKTWSTP